MRCISIGIDIGSTIIKVVACRITIHVLHIENMKSEISL